MEYYQNKVVLVTGAGSGLGLSIVNQLTKVPNCSILACGRSEARLKDVFAGNTQIQICCIDLEWEDGKIYEAVARIQDRYGRIDVLVNCAGMGFRGTVADTSMEVDRRIMQVDYFGQVAVIKGIRTAQIIRGGARLHIIQISSVQGYFGIGERASYSAAKHALVGFIDSLRAEVDNLTDNSDVIVTMVSPGYIATQHSCNALTGNGQLYSRNDETTVSGWPPEEVARKTLLGAANRQREVILADRKIKFLIIVRCIFAALCFRLIRNRHVGSKEPIYKSIFKWLIGCDA